MIVTDKFLIVSALICVNATAAYSQQDCSSYLRQATELVSQQKYCEAKEYYQKYKECDADADVSTEIAMCERRCGIQTMVGEEPETVVKTERSRQTSTSTSSDNRTPSSSQVVKSAKPPKPPKPPRTQGFNGFQLHGGIFLPQSDFAAGEDILGVFVEIPELGFGNAALGFNLGFKVYKPISSVQNLSWFLGADVFYNGHKSDYKDYLVEIAEDADWDYRLPFYLNAPITAGINYAYPINNTYSIYGELAAGVNISKYVGISYKGEPERYNAPYKDKWDIGIGFTYGLEAGVLINNKYTIGLKYMNLGAYKYKGETVSEFDEKTEKEKNSFLKELPISGISITAGILF